MSTAIDEKWMTRAIVDSEHISVIATNMDGIIQRFNKGAERLLGYKAEEMIGKQKALILHDPEEARRHGEETARVFGVAVGAGREGIISGAMLTGEPEEQVWTYIRKDGSRCKVAMSLSILRDDDGKMQGFLGISIPLPQSQA